MKVERWQQQNPPIVKDAPTGTRNVIVYRFDKNGKLVSVKRA